MHTACPHKAHCLFTYLTCISSSSLKYNQQDATFPPSIYFYKLLYMFQGDSPPIIRSTKLYIQRQVLSHRYCCLLLSWMRSIHVSGGFSTHHQEHKTVHTASSIARPILLPATIVDEMEHELHLIHDRLNSAKPYYSLLLNRLLFRLLSPNAKSKIQRTRVLSVVLHGCKTWSLKVWETHNPKTFN
jgi:hypothetical protein